MPVIKKNVTQKVGTKVVKKKASVPRKKAVTKRKKPGRKPWTPTPARLVKIRRFAAQGLTKEQIANNLGMHYDTLNEKSKLFPEINVAIKNGKDQGIQKVSNALYNKAMGGDNVSMIFYLKNRDPENWEDVQKRQLMGAGGGPILVGSTMALSDEQLAQIAAQAIPTQPETPALPAPEEDED